MFELIFDVDSLKKSTNVSVTILIGIKEVANVIHWHFMVSRIWLSLCTRHNIDRVKGVRTTKTHPCVYLRLDCWQLFIRLNRSQPSCRKTLRTLTDARTRQSIRHALHRSVCLLWVKRLPGWTTLFPPAWQNGVWNVPYELQFPWKLKAAFFMHWLFWGKSVY